MAANPVAVASGRRTGVEWLDVAAFRRVPLPWHPYLASRRIAARILRIMPYVALLRGINVGGNNKVEMARLRTVLTGLRY